MEGKGHRFNEARTGCNAISFTLDAACFDPPIDLLLVRL
jgi:hypothetical protein